MATYKGISLDTNLEHPYMPMVISTAVGDKESVIFDHVTVGDNFVNKNLTGVSVEFVCTLPDGKSVFSDTSGVKVDDAAKGIFTYTVPDNFARISGEVRDARFRFTKGDKVESSSLFKILIYKTPGILEQGGDYFNRLEDYLKLGMDLSNDLESLKSTADTGYKAKLQKMQEDLDKSLKDWTKTVTTFTGDWDETFKEKTKSLQTQFDEKVKLWQADIKKLNVDGMQTQITAIDKKITELKVAAPEFDFLKMREELDGVMSGVGTRNLFYKINYPISLKSNDSITVYFGNMSKSKALLSGKKDFMRGKKGVISFVIKNVGNSDVENPKISLRFDASGKVIVSSEDIGLLKVGEQKKIVKNITFPSNFNEIMYYDINKKENLSFEITDLSLKIGSVPTDWTPAPEDIEQSVKDVKNYVEAEFAKKVNNEPITFNKGFENVNVLDVTDDLNDLKLAGFFASFEAAKISNMPYAEGSGFTILVEKLSDNYVFQKVIRASDGVTFKRNCISGKWSGWVLQNYDAYTKSEVDTKISQAIAALKTELTKGDK